MGCFDQPTASKATADSKTAKQRTGVDKLLDIYLPRAGAGANIFPEGRVSPFSALQEKAIGGAGNFADLFGQPQTAGTPLFGETQKALTGALAGTTGAKPFTAADTADFFEQSIRQPTLKGFREDVIPGISESFAGPGFFGAARSQELSKATQDVNQQLGAARAALEFDVLGRNQQLTEAAAGRSLAAIPQAQAFSRLPAQNIQDNLNIAAQQLGGLQNVFNFGAAEQTQAQSELQDEIIRFAEENQLTDPQDLAIIMGLLGLNFSQSSSTGAGQGGIGNQFLSSFATSFGTVLGGG